MTATEPLVNRAVMEDKFFSATLKKLRTDAGMTQAELAKLVGLDQTAISLLERGAHGPSWNTVKQLCRVFNVSCETFTPPEFRRPKPRRPKGG